MSVCTQLYRHVVGVRATVLCVGTAHVHDTGPSSSSGAHHDIDVIHKTRDSLDIEVIRQYVFSTTKAYSLGAMK